MMKKDIFWTAAIFLALTVFVASAKAAVRVRVAPVQLPAAGMPLYPFPIETPTFPTLPMQLGSLETPSALAGTLKTPQAVAMALPDVSRMPRPTLPNGGIDIRLPEPIEKPQWPTAQRQVREVRVNPTELGVQVVRVVEQAKGAADYARQELPEDAFGDLLDEVRSAVGIREDRDAPTEVGLSRTFDGNGGNNHHRVMVALGDDDAPIDGTEPAADEDDGYVEPRLPRPIIGRSERMMLPEDELRRDLGIE